MDIKNIILAVIFTFSVLLLWESWTAQNQTETLPNNLLEKNEELVISNKDNFNEIPKPTVLKENDSSEVEFSPSNVTKPLNEEFYSIKK